MGKNYDNWERLVGAVLLREELRRVAMCHSMDSTSITTSQSSSFISREAFSLDSSFNFLRRDDQVHSIEPIHEPTGQENELEAFQTLVAKLFQGLAMAGSNDLLSIPWLHKLLATFLCCQEELKLILLNNRACLSKNPMDRYIFEFFEWSVKALDICNATCDGIEQIRKWQKSLQIVLYAFESKRISEAQFRHAKKALVSLPTRMHDEKDSNMSKAHRPLGSNSVQKEQTSFGQLRSRSWSVSRYWSAAMQLQEISNNLVLPKANDVKSTNGLNLAVFTMSNVLLFVMWALVAAIPCQDRGLQTHFNVSKKFLWAKPALSLHERILEESKRWDRRDACGLMREIHEIEICARRINELSDSVQFPLTDEKERDVRQRVKEVGLGLVYEALTDGLDSLERRVREVFYWIAVVGCLV